MSKQNILNLYIAKLRRAILSGVSLDKQYRLLQLVNLHSSKILPLEYFLEDINNYMLSENKKQIRKRDSIYGMCIEQNGCYSKKEYQKIYNKVHRDTHKIVHTDKPSKPRVYKDKKRHITSQKESSFFRKLKKSNIHGICFSCGETTFFIDSHHILGKKYNDMELSICVPCHYKYRGKNHCLNIGNKIEKLF